MYLNTASRSVFTTKDGSSSIGINGFPVTYHSHFGAIGESLKVYIETGLVAAFHQFSTATVKVFEMGFGTGLNALLTIVEAEKSHRKIDYTAIEQYPLTPEEISLLNYTDFLGMEFLFHKIHLQNWNEKCLVTPGFSLQKKRQDLLQYHFEAQYHLVYYDAFAPDAQPELWSAAILKRIFDALYPNGIFVTYCSKGMVRRTLQSIGFLVEKLPGPEGKREILRAMKPTV